MKLTDITLQLFPSVFYAVEVKEDLDSFFSEVKSLKFNKHESIYGDTKSHTSDNFYVLDAFTEVKRCIEMYVNYFKDNILGYSNTEVGITTSWITKTEPDGYSELHDHKNSWYSGVLYFDSIEDCGNLCITDTSKRIKLNNVPDELADTLNAETFMFAPQKNNMVLFPSYLNHRISRNNSNQDRYSLAFNIFPTSKFGQNDSTLNIQLSNK